MLRFIAGGWLGLALLLGLPGAHAQKLPPLAPIGPADFLSSTAVSPDSAAAAEILHDYGQSGIVGDQDKFQVVFERHARIHVLRKAGYEWATVRVPLYVHDGDQEKVSNLKGFTYNLVNGKVERTKLDAATGVFSEKLDKNHRLYTFTLPNVKEGSIVEFSYTIKSDFLFNLQNWQFQHDIPVRHSEYKVTLPAFFRYKHILRGYLPFAVDENRLVPYHTGYRQQQQGGFGGTAAGPTNSMQITTQAVEQRWVLRNAPAFREEPFMTTAQDYLRSVHFELAGTDFTGKNYQDISGTWEKIGANLQQNEQFGGYLNQGSPLTAEARALRTRFPDDFRARAQAVRELVQRTVQYNGDERLYAAQSVRKVCEQHRGSSAEVNLLLIQTLRAAGLEVTPLLLSTRRHGRVAVGLPLVSQFNYVVAHLPLADGQELLLDATEPLTAPGQLPERCLNEQGLLLHGAGRWVALSTTSKHLQYTNAHLTLDDAGQLRGTVRLEYDGYAALEARQSILAQGEATYRQQLTQHWADWQFTSPPTLRQIDAPGKLAVVELAVALPGPETPAALLYLPLMQPFGIGGNPFRHAERFFPVDFSTLREHTQNLTLTLPAHYVVQEQPANMQLVLPGNAGRFLYQVTQPTPGTVQFSARLQLLKTSFNPQEYAALREFYSRAIAKYAEPLVLQRK